MSHPIRSIVIVGGGTAGWICAGTIAAAHKTEHKDGLKITLIESPNTPTIGVGEGTWPTMRNTLRKMGISETDFIRECNAGFKQGAKFAKWVTGAEDDAYYHPLMIPQGFLEGNLAPHWLANDQGMSFSARVCPQETVCEHGLAPKQITTPEYAAVLNYAYHLDAGKFATLLQRHCTQKLGVHHILDDVTDINSAENGDIASLSTKNNGDLAGDLFVDCTGFRSVLLGGHFGIQFRSRQHQLFIDRALAVQVPYHDDNAPVATHTISTAQSCGWVWDIGLSSRRGIGHVYSSAHTSEDGAMAELGAYLQNSNHHLKDYDVRQIKFNPGHRELFWKQNCVGVGLSAGFLEPLEASALVLVELSANMIAEQMPVTRASMDIVAKRFNNKFLYRWDRVIDFLKLHYILNQRVGEPFWDDNRKSETIPDSLSELMDLWQHHYPWHDDFDQKDEVFPSASYQYVLYGMKFRTQSSHLWSSGHDQQFAQNQFRQNEETTQRFLSGLPPHRELLTKIHEHGLQSL